MPTLGVIMEKNGIMNLLNGIWENIKKEINMPKGKGTYGSKRGRPKKKNKKNKKKKKY